MDRVLAVGTAVDHATRGHGTIVEVLDHDARNKPYKVRFLIETKMLTLKMEQKVRFESGEVHQYSEFSAAKLKARCHLALSVGMRVQHETRGVGSVVEVLSDGAHKPYKVVFDVD